MFGCCYLDIRVEKISEGGGTWGDMVGICLLMFLWGFIICLFRGVGLAGKCGDYGWFGNLGKL